MDVATLPAAPSPSARFQMKRNCPLGLTEMDRNGQKWIEMNRNRQKWIEINWNYPVEIGVGRCVTPSRNFQAETKAKLGKWRKTPTQNKDQFQRWTQHFGPLSLDAFLFLANPAAGATVAPSLSGRSQPDRFPGWWWADGPPSADDGTHPVVCFHCCRHPAQMALLCPGSSPVSWLIWPGWLFSFQNRKEIFIFHALNRPSPLDASHASSICPWFNRLHPGVVPPIPPCTSLPLIQRSSASALPLMPRFSPPIPPCTSLPLIQLSSAYAEPLISPYLPLISPRL